jgi:hypothetical protein
MLSSLKLVYFKFKLKRVFHFLGFLYVLIYLTIFETSLAFLCKRGLEKIFYYYA